MDALPPQLDATSEAFDCGHLLVAIVIAAIRR
jgi:hypothetical protein